MHLLFNIAAAAVLCGRLGQASAFGCCSSSCGGGRSSLLSRRESSRLTTATPSIKMVMELAHHQTIRNTAADAATICSGSSSGKILLAAGWGRRKRHNGATIDAALHSKALASSKEGGEENEGTGGLAAATRSIDFGLLFLFGLWYLGNYLYKITNKRALQAAGGVSGFPMTISSLQLGIGSLYGIFLWFARARKTPSVTSKDLIQMFPLAFCYAGAHCGSSFAYSAGSVSFAEIVKAAEPAFAAVLAQFVYRRPVSKAKWLCLPFIIGGVVLATAKELDFALIALITACIANMFAAFRANENKRIIDAGGLKDRIGSVGNQFALTSILGFVMTLPFLLVLEGNRWGKFVQVLKTSREVRVNLIASAIWFYLYNEVSTKTLKKTGAVTQSVANTAKRVIVLVGAAMVFGESWTAMKALGCAVAIGSVFVYSIVDQLPGSKK